MKNIIITSILISLVSISFATILNVDKNENRPIGYYNDLQIAINQANAGDSIYVYPSNTSYGDITVTKKLHFFGSGYDGTIGCVSKIGNFALDTSISPSSSSSGTSIQGLTIANLVCNKSNINNITVNGCYIYSTYINIGQVSTNWTIKNNLIANYININYSTSIIISNNIFIGNNTVGIYYSNSSSVVISNNLFFNWNYFYDVFNATISNNIFICSDNANQTHMANNQFINNLSWRSTTYPYNLPPIGNTGSNNKSNLDPLFETGNALGTFDYTKDYHLKSTSPGKNAGTDATDIGPYGGTNPFVWGGALTIPMITEMTISNPIINQGTNINVNIKAKKADL